ncbi:inositol monophosphatase family protein [Desulfosediminicola ganghwensis]|uniref:inositol monophosphatase family protein n=1 Tax=Desulfosediminicola ganghwensis TaxID=2569540 RepID=UPI0010AC3143|nr:inositol monophosphatase family protein [Desulfosediminicola ganghwensis]
MNHAFLNELAEAAGAICVAESASFKEVSIEYKSARDLVTSVDKKVEAYLRSRIAAKFPNHSILGEEQGLLDKQSDSCWIIDPIDGTNSYIQGLPGYTVSIALQRKGEIVAGVVYAPVLGQMFSAERGKGACLNNNRITVSGTSKLIDSVLSSGFACIREGFQPDNLGAFSRVIPKVRDFRRHGSAALDLAWVAAGKLDGYWEQCLNIYDVAAGVLLVQEAGGMLTDYRGGIDYPAGGLVATNGLIHEQLRKLVVEE